MCGGNCRADICFHPARRSVNISRSGFVACSWVAVLEKLISVDLEAANVWSERRDIYILLATYKSNRNSKLKIFHSSI